ncbi:MAG: 30S ribosome-binding factor RbfA [Bacilli bacterium]|nr:30S ribosome-binding factor RbfA [Bacilli bacterium]
MKFKKSKEEVRTFFGISRVNRYKQRTKSDIEHVIRNVIYHHYTKNNKIGFLSINHIEINNDLSVIKIYVSFFEDYKKSEKAIKMMNKDKKIFKEILCSKLNLRKMPGIVFIFDDRFLASEKIEKILKS